MITLVLNRMKLWQKLGWLVLAMAIPATLVGFFYLRLANGQVSQARDELDGAAYLRALGVVEGEIFTHRSRAFVCLSGDAARRNDVASQAEEVERQIIALDKINATVGKRFGVDSQWEAVKAEWETVKGKTPTQTPVDMDATHATLIEHIQQLTDVVSVRSQTLLDPDATTHTLIRIASDYTPTALLHSNDLRRYAVRAAAKGYLGGDDRMGVQISRERFKTDIERIRSDLDRLPADSYSELRTAFEGVLAASGTYEGVIKDKLTAASNLTATGAEIYDAGVPTNRALKKMSIEAYQQSVKALETRYASLNVHRDICAGISFTLLTLGLVLAWLVARSLTHPLGRAVEVFGSIATGHYDSKIDTSGTDEAGQVLRALNDMQDKLRTRIENERAVAAENIRIRQALDKASTSIVLADEQHKIIYLNDVAQASFARNTREIRNTLPGFDAAHLRGANLESLSPDAASERRVLENLKSANVQERVLGEFTFRTVTNPVIGERGERLGTVMEWSQRTQEVRVERELQTMLSAINGGQLGKRIDLAGKSGFFEAMSRGINQLADNITATVSMVKSAAEEIHRGAQEISQGNSNLSLRTEEQAASLEETASSMEQMTQTVKQNADNAGQANQLALAARDQAEQGGQVVGNAVRAMSGINDSARQIADIIGVIDEIAFQTNLLALNAAVEAARAGEQGRGFAVVASEVRNLAGRSATAAKEIKDLIQDSVKKVEDGSHLVTQSGNTLEQIVHSVKKVSDIVAEIAAASREQSLGIDQVGRAIAQMDELTQQNAALVEQATAASQGMATEAGSLNTMLDHYDFTGVAQVNSAVTAPAATSGAARKKEATSSAPPRLERRKASRPWADRPAPKTAPAASRPETAVASATRAQARAENGADSNEWTEF